MDSDFGDIQQIVTCDRPDGESDFQIAGPAVSTVVDLDPGTTYWLVWGTDDAGQATGSPTSSVVKPFFPGPGGSRFMVVRFPADGAEPAVPKSDAKQRELRARADEALPGLFDAHDADPSGGGFHRTPTLDYAFVADGELVLELDGGRTRTVKQGACIVQRGTRHAWRNHSGKPATVVFVIVGAGMAEVDDELSS